MLTINPSYLSRVLRMTLLAPDLIEAALAGRQPEGMTLAWAMGNPPVAAALCRPSSSPIVSR